MTHPSDTSFKITVLIPFRNEASNLPALIESLKIQNRESIQVEFIFIDDHSEDGFDPEPLFSNIDQFKLLKLPIGKEGKKAAIRYGIEHSVGDLIITIDADCTMNEHWLNSIAGFYRLNRPAMIVAPVLASNGHGMMHAFQNIELAVLSATAAGSLKLGYPTLASGANLAFERSAYLLAKSAMNEDLASGDDVFLLSAIHKYHPERALYLKSPQAVVKTAYENSISAIFQQKKRWASKTFSYELRYMGIMAMVVFLGNFSIILGFLWSVFNPSFLPIFVSSFMLKILVDFVLFKQAAEFYRLPLKPHYFFISSLFYPAYVVLIGSLAPVTGYRWKHRSR